MSHFILPNSDDIGETPITFEEKNIDPTNHLFRREGLPIFAFLPQKHLVRVATSPSVELPKISMHPDLSRACLTRVPGPNLVGVSNVPATLQTFR